MCYNAAKNWQIGWYDNRKILINPIDEPNKTVTLVGVADYLNNPSGHPVVVKVETGSTNDFFVGFNRAIGANAQNDEGDNVVTVVQVSGNDGEGYSQSFLKAKLAFEGDTTGTSYSIQNFGGTAYPLTISVQSIDLNSSPATAVVTFQYDSGTNSPSNTQSVPPTVMPTISSSSSPSSSISNRPSQSPVRTTPSPTAAPSRTASSNPSQSPVRTTPSPTVSPTAFDVCTLNDRAKQCKANNNCLWLGGGICIAKNSAPSGPTTPSPTPPSGGVCSSNSCSFCGGGGTCRAAGCVWNKGVCS
jgi:hypothetical protein